MSDRYGLRRRFGGLSARRESAYRPGGDSGHRTPGHGEADADGPGLADHLRYEGDWRSLVRSDRDEAYREFFTPYSERRLAAGEVRPAASARFSGGLLLWLGLAILLSGPPGGPGVLGPFHL